MMDQSIPAIDSLITRSGMQLHFVQAILPIARHFS
jgi:hypothetical protein